MTYKTPEAEVIASLSPSEFWQRYEDLANDGDEDGAAFLLIERCRHDVEAFSLAFFPHYCKHDFNEFHRALFADWRFPARALRQADAAPRGHAKSTLKTLVKPIHDLCYGLEKFIVIISDTATQAAGKLKDIRSELLENMALNAHFGPFFDTKRVAETAYEARSGSHRCRFEAYGAGSEIRGIRFGEARPTKIILDDAENSEEVHNEELRAKREDWLKEVVSKLGDETTNLEIVGTKLHRDSMLSNLLKNPAYSGRMYKAVISWSDRGDLWEKWRALYVNLDDPLRHQTALAFYEAHRDDMDRGTEILWPGRYTYYTLMVEMIELGRKAFLKEMQNDPVANDHALFDTFHWYTETPAGLVIERSGAVIPWNHLSPAMASMDPATGQTKPKPGKLGDYNSILVGYKDPKGRLYVHADWTKRAAPTKAIASIFDLYDLYRFETMAVETNLYRNLLLPNIMEAKRVREEERRKAKKDGWGINIKFYDVENVENKIKRIYTLEPKVENGYILFNKALSGEFKNQMETFPLGEHDDGPDALEMLWSLANGRYQTGGLSLHAQRGR